jgi:hypothetical protein
MIFSRMVSIPLSSDAFIYKYSASRPFTISLAREVLPPPAEPYNNRFWIEPLLRNSATFSLTDSLPMYSSKVDGLYFSVQISIYIIIFARSSCWFFFSGLSTIVHSVVNIVPATEAAFSRAHLVTFVGSIIPFSIKST